MKKILRKVLFSVFTIGGSPFHLASILPVPREKSLNMKDCLATGPADLELYSMQDSILNAGKTG
ncbi:MAG: hypothetical protein ACYCYP_13250 [Leptospirales bacterium]